MKVGRNYISQQETYLRLKKRHELRVCKRQDNIRTNICQPIKQRPGVHEDLSEALQLIHTLLNPSPEK